MFSSSLCFYFVEFPISIHSLFSLPWPNSLRSLDKLQFQWHHILLHSKPFKGGRGDRSIHEPVLKEDQSKAVSSGQDRTDTCIISEQLWWPIQNQSSQYSFMEKVRVNETPPQTEELPMDGWWLPGREIKISLKEPFLLGQTQIYAWLHTQDLNGQQKCKPLGC